MDSDDEDTIINLVVSLWLIKVARRASRQPFASGRRSLSNWLHHPDLFFNTVGLTVPTFTALIDWLLSHTDLDDGQVSLAEKTMLFLHVCRKGAGYRETQIIFNRSLNTIST
jgi:hypothetical protein